MSGRLETVNLETYSRTVHSAAFSQGYEAMDLVPEY